jgi:hypothetical protein
VIKEEPGARIGSCSTGTTEFGVFAESGDPLGEGPFPLVEGFAKRKLPAKATTTRKPTFYDKNSHDREEYRHTMFHNMTP